MFQPVFEFEAAGQELHKSQSIVDSLINQFLNICSNFIIYKYMLELRACKSMNIHKFPKITLTFVPETSPT